jgi:hypothetical protein
MATIQSFMDLPVLLPVLLSSPCSGPQSGYRTMGTDTMESLDGWMNGWMLDVAAVAASEK